jgi:hypothetical protein
MIRPVVIVDGVPMYRPELEVDNDDRAAMVTPLVDAFSRSYYWHPGGEPLEDVVADLIGDLLHYCERLPEYELTTPRDEDEGYGPLDWARGLLDRAYQFYVDEYEEERFNELRSANDRDREETA